MSGFYEDFRGSEYYNEYVNLYVFIASSLFINKPFSSSYIKIRNLEKTIKCTNVCF